MILLLLFIQNIILYSLNSCLLSFNMIYYIPLIHTIYNIFLFYHLLLLLHLYYINDYISQFGRFYYHYFIYYK